MEFGRVRNKLFTYTLNNQVCMNCNLQQRSKYWWVMVCHCGCGKSSIFSKACVKEHSRYETICDSGIKVIPDLKNKKYTYMCKLIKCKNACNS